MKINHPLLAMLAAPSLRQFDVVLHLGVQAQFSFRVEAPSAEHFHDFLRDARESAVAWVKVNAIREEDDSAYVTGFDPRIVIGMDVTPVAEPTTDWREVKAADEAEDGPCGPDCTCFPQPSEEPAQGVSPGAPADGRPFTAEEAAALDGKPENPAEALERMFRDLGEKGREGGRPPMPPFIPGLLGLAILASALKPPSR